MRAIITVVPWMGDVPIRAKISAHYPDSALWRETELNFSRTAETGQIFREGEGTLWVRGWDTPESKALRAAAMLVR